MGIDISSWVEVRESDGVWRRQTGDLFPHDEWEVTYYGRSHGEEPFRGRSYALFGFLADIRNYAESPYIAGPRGLPVDVDEQECGYILDDSCGSSWVTLEELLAFDYEQTFYDQSNRSHESVRDFLGEDYFEVLDCCTKLGQPQDVRIVFWFSA